MFNLYHNFIIYWIRFTKPQYKLSEINLQVVLPRYFFKPQCISNILQLDEIELPVHFMHHYFIHVAFLSSSTCRHIKYTPFYINYLSVKTAKYNLTLITISNCKF